MNIKQDMEKIRVNKFYLEILNKVKTHWRHIIDDIKNKRAREGGVVWEQTENMENLNSL
jgi:hypothetical protein